MPYLAEYFDPRDGRLIRRTFDSLPEATMMAVGAAEYTDRSSRVLHDMTGNPFPIVISKHESARIRANRSGR